MKHFGKMIVGACTVLTLTCTPANCLLKAFHLPLSGNGIKVPS